MQILVDKLLALQPDLLCVGKAVSRHAQEQLTRRGVTLMQHVKPEVRAEGREGGREGTKRVDLAVAGCSLLSILL